MSTRARWCRRAGVWLDGALDTNDIGWVDLCEFDGDLDAALTRLRRLATPATGPGHRKPRAGPVTLSHSRQTRPGTPPRGQYVRCSSPGKCLRPGTDRTSGIPNPCGSKVPFHLHGQLPLILGESPRLIARYQRFELRSCFPDELYEGAACQSWWPVLEDGAPRL